MKNILLLAFNLSITRFPNCSISFLRHWPSRFDRRRHIEVFDVFREPVAQIFGSLVISGLIAPGIARIQNLRRNSAAPLRNAEPERRLDLELSANEFALDGCVNHSPGMRNAHTLAYAIATALPSSVDQP